MRPYEIELHTDVKTHCGPGAFIRAFHSGLFIEHVSVETQGVAP
jgi:hypothetical protein